MKPLLISSGEPAGIGPDLCLQLSDFNFPVVILCDKNILIHRANTIKKNVIFIDYCVNKPIVTKPGYLTVLSIPCISPVIAGTLNIYNAKYVINLLDVAIHKCLKQEFSGLITAPVNKFIIKKAGINFVGHTEFLANRCNVDTVVMMLVCKSMKVALITTHIPLKDVSSTINISMIVKSIICLNQSLKTQFSIYNPIIFVSALNPHAGENGYLGTEEIDIIIPALNILKNMNIKVEGPFPADTLFSLSNILKCDVFVTMYHDQGLSVIKYKNIFSSVNVTLGLPIIRTSVDHGTALNIAGTNLVCKNSLIEAIKLTKKIVKNLAIKKYD